MRKSFSERIDQISKYIKMYKEDKGQVPSLDEIGLVPMNVATRVDRPKKENFEPQFLSADELETMFKALRGTPFELPVLVASFYGLRRGEVLGLKWDIKHPYWDYVRPLFPSL